MAGLRIGGLASGMDIDTIVSDMMKAERIPLDKLLQKKTTFEMQRDEYRSINTKLSTFDKYLFDNFTLSSNFNKKTVEISNPNLISATATSAATGSLSIESVSQLATAARQVGDKIAATGSTKMSALTPSVGGTTISLKAIQADGTIAAEATNIDIKATDTIDEVVSKINGSNAGVTALFENGQLSITAKNTGDIKDGPEIQITAGLDVFKSLGVSVPVGTDPNIPYDLASSGTNAIFKVNGIETERSTNNFTISGYNLTLKSTFNEPSATSNVGAVQLTASTDVNSMVDKVKEFVEKYNELISGMNDKLKETKYRDYSPLTEEQRKDMSEKEQELWDAKAKSGVLKSDSIISGGLSNMRNAIYSRVGGIGDNMIDTLAEMGITTSSSYTDGGKLIINEEKLRTALTENPDQVAKTLTQSGTKTSSEDTRGIVQRLRESMKEVTTKIETKAGKSSFTDQQYSIGKQLIDTESRITNFQSRLVDIEARLWKQFTAMEQAINKANQQSAMLLGQTSGS